MKEVYGNTGVYTSGGRNVVSDRYCTGGSLPYKDRPVWLGVLEGDWYDIGLEFGQKTGDMIASCSDYWWKMMCSTRGPKATIHAMKEYLAQVKLLDETQIELLKGITDGAAEYLAASPYHGSDSPWYAPDLLRVYAAAIFDVWIWGDPDSYGDPAAGPNNLAEEFISGKTNGCNSVAVRGSANIYGKTISTQVRHTQQAGLCYQASAVYRSADGSFHDVWSVGNVPTPHGLLLVNDQGVSISHHFGGATSEASLKAGCYGCAYGVPWPNLLFYAIKHAGTAEEAIDILIHGTEEYRRKTGRKTILRDGTWNWMVCDRNSISVVEVSPDRYAVRRPGEYTGDWKQQDYIVAANHFICPFSYDENDILTDVPMSIFNVNPTSEKRFWNLMWEMKDFAGSIDLYTLEYIFSRTYLRDRETGEYICTMQDETGKWGVTGQAFGCVQGTLNDGGRSNGANSAKIAILDKGRSSCSFCLGNPMDWAGEWDNFTFDK